MIVSALKDAANAVRANGKAAIMLWLFASAILLLYFKVEIVRPYFDSVSLLKLKLGFIFSFISTALFGAVVPAILKKITGVTGNKLEVKKSLYLIMLWGFKGMEVDLLYRIQASVFGNGNETNVLLKKLAVDQLLYVPIWAVPSLVALLMLPEIKFNLHNWTKRLFNGFYKKEILPVLIPNWAVWAPSALMIYSLPTALQVPMQNLVLCFWVLILTFLVGPKETKLS